MLKRIINGLFGFSNEVVQQDTQCVTTTASKSAVAVAVAATVLPISPVGRSIPCRIGAVGRTGQTSHSLTIPNKAKPVPALDDPPGSLKSDAAKKTSFILSSMIAGHLDRFSSAIAGREWKSFQDFVATVGEMTIHAKKLDQSIGLLVCNGETLLENGTIEEIKKIGDACLLFCETLPVIDLRSASGVLHSDSGRGRAPALARLLDTDALQGWCKKHAEGTQSLYDIAASSREVPKLPMSISTKLETIAGFATGNLAYLLSNNLLDLEEFMRLHCKSVDEIPSEWRNFCRRDQSSVSQAGAKNLTIREIGNGLDATEHEHRSTLRLTKEIADFLPVVDSINALLAKRVSEKKISLPAWMVETTGGNLRATCLSLNFRTYVTRLRLAASAPELLFKKNAPELIAAIDKIGLAFNKLSLDERESAYLFSDENACVWRKFSGALTAQYCALENDLRRLHADLKEEATSSYQSPLQNTVIELVSDVAQVLGEIKVAYEDMLPDQSAGDPHLNAQQENYFDQLKARHLDPLIELAEAPVKPVIATLQDDFALAENSRRASLQADNLVQSVEKETAQSNPAIGSNSGRSRRAKAVKKLSVKKPSDILNSKNRLHRAYEHVEQATANVRNVMNEASIFAKYHLDAARTIVAHPGIFPHRPSVVRHAVGLASDCFTRGAARIEEELHVLRSAKQEIDNLETDIDVKETIQCEIASKQKRWQMHLAGWSDEVSRLRSEADCLGRSQSINCFLAYPTYGNYMKLAEDDTILISAQLTLHKKLLAPITFLGFQKPTADYLDVFRINVAESQPDRLEHGDAWVELHLHYDSNEKDATPNCAHLKNFREASHGGPDVYRGKVPRGAVNALAKDVRQRAVSGA